MRLQKTVLINKTPAFSDFITPELKPNSASLGVSDTDIEKLPVTLFDFYRLV